eukprot:TRINITY_DN110076_c0_g1_i1.p1 TRINITY_DN110076_c0_g1~~TRINITY_DN110076_c0_g1_i1.p1  ORF type:complete len:367 (+),score=72.91 TRINITY_DN110076_c0_g1_i1:56-1102(+)
MPPELGAGPVVVKSQFDWPDGGDPRAAEAEREEQLLRLRNGFGSAEPEPPPFQRQLLPALPCLEPPVEAAEPAPLLPPLGLSAAELCCFCFQVLQAHLKSLPLPRYPSVADQGFKAPLFVTWLKPRAAAAAAAHKAAALACAAARPAVSPAAAALPSEHCCPDEASGASVEATAAACDAAPAPAAATDNLELRGCIGCLEPIHFHSGLSEYAIRSSMKDRRFPPVKLDEVSSLTCRLSILHQFEPCAHAFDWQVGLHGVLLNFSDSHGRKFSATYLPEVAKEHGMSREVAIRELVAKSGYGGPCTPEILDCMEVTRYQTIVESVAFREIQSICPHYVCGHFERNGGYT